jgi:hypothetical protein
MLARNLLLVGSLPYACRARVLASCYRDRAGALIDRPDEKTDHNQMGIAGRSAAVGCVAAAITGVIFRGAWRLHSNCSRNSCCAFRPRIDHEGRDNLCTHAKINA